MKHIMLIVVYIQKDLVSPDTMGLKYGPSLTELDEMISRFPSDDLGVAVAYKTGDEVLTVGNMTYDDHNIIIGCFDGLWAWAHTGSANSWKD